MQQEGGQARRRVQRRRRRRGLVLPAIWLWLAVWGTALPLQGMELPLSVQAESLMLRADYLELDPDSGQVSASGAVRLLLGDVEAQADALALDIATGQLVLSGSVRVHASGLALESESLWLTWQEGRLVVLNGRLRLPSGGEGAGELLLHAARLTRETDGSWELESADISPCDCGERISPTFRLRCQSLTIRPGESVTARRATVDLHDTPVFHFHEISLSLKSRRTRLLPPRLGYADHTGARLVQDLFIVVDEDSDLTLGIDAMTRRGVAPRLGLHSETERFQWESRGFYLYDLRGDEADIARHRFGMDVSQTYRPRPWLRQVLNAAILSDSRLGRDFGWTWQERERDFAVTDLGLEMRFSEVELSLLATAEQRLFEPIRPDGWLFGQMAPPAQHLGPELRVQLPGFPVLDGRLLLQGDARLQGWWHSHDPDRIVTGDPQNPKALWVLALNPLLRAPLVLSPGVEAELWAGLAHASRFPPGEQGESEHGGTPDLGARLGLAAFRTYDGAGERPFTHSLRPSLLWNWSEHTYGDWPGAGVRSPEDPSVPPLPVVHHLTLRLEQSLSGAGQVWRDWLRLALWQRVLLDAPSRERAGSWLDAGMIEADSDAGYVRLGGALGLDWHRAAVQNAGLWARATPGAGVALHAGWRYACAGEALGLWWWQRRSEGEPVLHQAVFSPSYSPLSWLRLSYRVDVRLDEPGLIEQSGRLAVNGVCNCWGAELAVVHRPPHKAPDFWLSVDLSQWVTGR